MIRRTDAAMPRRQYRLMKCRFQPFLALLLGCLVAAGAAAQTVTARGARNCALWTENRIDERGGHLLGAQFYQTWLVGYLSGMAAGTGTDILSGTRNGALFLRVDRYCAENPGANLAQAGATVARELMAAGQTGVIYWGAPP